VNAEINLGQFAGTVAGLMVVGGIIKNAVPKIPNGFIPLILLALGMVSYLSMTNGWRNPAQYVEAAIAAATAVGAHGGTRSTKEALIGEKEEPPKTPDA